MAKAYLEIDSNVDELIAKLETIEQAIKRIEKKVNLDVNSSKVSRATQEVSKLEAAGKRVESVFSGIGGAMQSVGGYMQSLGNTFGGKVVDTVKTMATAFGTMGLYSAAEGTVKRYDIMKMFPKQMKHIFGDTAEVAQQATETIQYLEQAVLGLPTGLDEIAQNAQQFIMLTGDMKRGADIAIAANNAFLASGANAKQVYFAQEQLRDLLSAGELGETEWRSLLKGLGASLGPIAEQLGYSGKVVEKVTDNADKLASYEKRAQQIRTKLDLWRTEGGHKESDIKKNEEQLASLEKTIESLSSTSEKDLGDFRQALKKNEISANEFLDAMIAAGTNGGEIEKRAWEYKATLSATAYNIKNAIQRLGEAALLELDEALLGETGKDLPNTIISVSEAIKQKLTPALKDWLSSHHQQIGDFVDRLMSYDWLGLVSKVAGGLAKYYDLITGFFTKISPDVIAFLSVWAGPVGRMLGAGGGVVKGIGGVIGGVLKWLGRLGGGSGKAVEEGAETLAKTAGSIGKFGGAIKSAFAGIGLAAGSIAVIGELGLVIAEYVKIGEMIGKTDWGNFDKNIGKVGKFIASVSGIAGTLIAGGFLVGKSKTASLALAIGEGLAGGAVAIMAGIGGVIAEYVKIADQVATMDIPSDARIKDLGKTVKSITTNLLGSVKKVPNKDVAALSNLSEATSYAVDIATELKRLKEVGNVGDMSKKIGNVIKAANEILKANYDKSDQKKSGIINKTLGNVKEATDSVSSIATTLSESKDTIKALTDKQGMTDMKINIGIMMESLVGDATTGNGGVLNRFQQKTAEYENMEKNMGSFSAAITSLSEMMQTLVDAKSNISALVKQGHGKLMYTDVGKQIDTLITSVSKPFKKNKLFANTKEYSVVSSNMEKFSTIASSVSTIAKSLVDSMANLDALTRKTPHGGLYVMEDSDMIKKIGAVIRNVKSVADTFKHSDIDTSGEAIDKATALSDVVGALPTLFENLQGLAEPISSLGVSGEDWQLGDDIKTIITGIQGAFAELSSSDYADLVTNAESLKGATDQLSGIMDGLQAVQDKISGLGIADGVWQAGLDLGTAINTITGIFPQNFGQTMAGGDALGGAAANLNAIAGALEKIAANAGSASGNLDKAKSSLDAFGKAAGTHKKDIGQVAAQTARLKSALDGIFGKGMTAAMGVNAVGSAAGAQAWNLRSAASAAASLAAAISSIPTNKTVNVTTNYATTNASGTAAASSGIHSVGGHITRASGGPVWGRGGIDNIPAMLSNGEFVMRSRAHSTFGTAFMNRINNLDVEGAMRALSLRAGSGILSRAKVTNNYTRDNHANVTFNVNRATQGYAQRRASRWARALS